MRTPSPTATIVPATSPESLRAYLRWQLAHALAPSLSKGFVDENFEFFGKRLRGANIPMRASSPTSRMLAMPPA